MSYLFPAQTITFDAALRDLEAGSPRARAVAAHALGEVTAPEEKRRAVGALIAALDDARSEVRAEAAAALGVLADPRAVAGLARRLDDGDPAVRQCAAIALGSIGHVDAWEPLAQALRQGPPDLRFQAASSLTELDPPRAFDPLIAALDDDDPQVLAAIALALGAIGDGRAAGHLARLVDHADPGVRFDAGYALAQLGDGRGRDALAAALLDVERGWDAIDSLERLGTAADADVLGRVPGDRRAAPQLQLRAAGALLTIAPDHARAEAARKVLLAGTTLRKPELRGLAVDELAKVGGPWAIDALARLRNHRRGKDLVDEIDQALRAIETPGAAMTAPMPIELFDSHAHVDGPEFDADREQVLARARAAGVRRMVVIGAVGDISSAGRAVALAERDPDIYATVATHPHDVAQMTDAWWAEHARLARHPRVVAVGETGLDYYYQHSPREVQQAAFRRFLAMAAEVDKPVICHIRDAHDDARAILAASGWKRGIIHCFTGTPDDAQAYAELGYHVSFSGIVTYKNAQPIRDAVRRVPVDQILIETDCPYLSPVPMRGKRNEPAFVVHTAEVVARELGLPLADLAARTVANTCAVFGLT